MRLANIGWNFLGLSVPLAAAAVSIPTLIATIGLERFGLLALSWGLLGFAGAFDLGVGRATTQAIGRLRGRGELPQIPIVFRTATMLSLSTGLIGALTFGIAILTDVQSHIRLSPALHGEASAAGYLLAITIPFQSMSAMFRGINEAFENFYEVSLLRIGLGITNFFGPYCVAFFTPNLTLLVFTLLISRIFALFFYWKFANSCLNREIPRETHVSKTRPSPEVAMQLLSFGGWFTLSCVVGPIISQADRFVIATQISAEAVSTFAIPYEVVAQSLIVVGAFTTVAFPNLAAMVHSRPDQVRTAFRRWLRKIVPLMIATASLCALSLPHLLPWWIGPGMPQESVLIGQILCLALIPYTFATTYVALIHAYGRPDITAKVHLLQLPIVLGLLYWLVREYGVQGAAWAWVFRVTFDACVSIAWFNLCDKNSRITTNGTIDAKN